MSLVLHGLPLLNISDYYTRSALMARSSSHPQLLAGILFGVRSNHEINIENAAELKIGTDGTIDFEYLLSKVELYKVNFPDHEALGWFQICGVAEFSQSKPPQSTLQTHMSIQERVDLPVVVLFNAVSPNGRLPLRAFELVFRDGAADFSELQSIKIDTAESERTALNDVMKGAGSQGSALGAITSQLATESNASRMFHRRLCAVKDYVAGVRAGIIEPDHAILRKIDAFVSQLDGLKSDNGASVNRVLSEQELAALVGGLAAVTIYGNHLKNEVLPHDRRMIASD